MGEYEHDACNCGVEAQDRYEIMEQRLMQMTFWAHKAALFEKIKEKIGKEEGKNLDQLADLLIQGSKEEAQSSKESEKKQEELRKKLEQYFN